MFYIQCKFDYYRVNTNGNAWTGRGTSRGTKSNPQVHERKSQAKKTFINLNKSIKFSDNQMSLYFFLVAVLGSCACIELNQFLEAIRWCNEGLAVSFWYYFPTHKYFFTSRKAWNQKALNGKSERTCFTDTLILRPFELE